VVSPINIEVAGTCVSRQLYDVSEFVRYVYSLAWLSVGKHYLNSLRLFHVGQEKSPET
jgi:hypothetical protein